MPVHSSPSVNEHSDGDAESVVLNDPTPGPSASGPLARTDSKDSLARKARAHEKSSRKRQVTRTPGAQEHAVERAHKSRVKKLAAQAARPKPPASSNPFMRGLNYLVNKFAPLFGMSADCPVSDGDGSYSDASSDVSDSASQVSTDVSDSASQVSTELNESTSTEGPNASGEITMVEIPSKPVPLKIPRPTVNFHDEDLLARLNYEREMVAKALIYAQEQERARRTRVQLFEKDKAEFGEKRAISLQWGRDMMEQKEKRLKEAREALELEKDLDERRNLLLQGEQAMRREQGWLEEAARKDQRLQRQQKYLEARPRVANTKASRADLISHEERSTRRAADSLRFDTPTNPSNYHYTRDRTTISRSNHTRFHPYSSSAWPVHSNSARHFNNSEAPTRSGSSLQYHASAKLGSITDQFISYDEHWQWLNSPIREVLTFSSVPWPLRTAPRTPLEVTTEKVREFLLLARCGTYDAKPAQCKRVAFDELVRWYPSSVKNLILARVKDRAEREAVREAANNVQKALVLLMASE